MTAGTPPSVPLPPGAEIVEDWDDTDPPERVIALGSYSLDAARVDEPACVFLYATQYSNGSFYFGEDGNSARITVDTCDR
jgi:hypothetical protein